MASDSPALVGELQQAAVPFISWKDGRFEVNPAAVDYLNALDSPLGVVAIAGLYRSGKSFLLNALMEKPGGFQVGPTVNACTKGLWLWGEAVQAEGRKMHILFLDTEGLGSTSRGETEDARIFALALLLSSYFIYNSRGVIDNGALEQLSLVAQLTNHIKVNTHSAAASASAQELAEHFPGFMWTLRDFTLRLEEGGRAITARTYLDNALKEQGAAPEDGRRNAVRRMLRSCFPDRDCVTLVRPVESEAELHRLHELPQEALRGQFREQVASMRTKVLRKVQPKTLFGNTVTGPMLAQLALAYTEAINSGGVPTISSAWERVVRQQAAQALEAAWDTFQREAARAADALRREAAAGVLAAAEARAVPLVDAAAIGDAAMAIDDDALVGACDAALQQAQALFWERAVGNRAEQFGLLQQLQRRVSEHIAQLRQRNRDASLALCRAVARDAVRARTQRADADASESDGAAAAAGSPAAGRCASAVRASVHQLRQAQADVAAIGRGPAVWRVAAEEVVAASGEAAVRACDGAEATWREELEEARAETKALAERAAAQAAEARATREDLERRVRESEERAASAAAAHAREVQSLRALLSVREEEVAASRAQLTRLTDLHEQVVGRLQERVVALERERAAVEGDARERVRAADQAREEAEERAEKARREGRRDAEEARARAESAQTQLRELTEQSRLDADARLQTLQRKEQEFREALAEKERSWMQRWEAAEAAWRGELRGMQLKLDEQAVAANARVGDKVREEGERWLQALRAMEDRSGQARERHLGQMQEVVGSVERRVEGLREEVVAGALESARQAEEDARAARAARDAALAQCSGQDSMREELRLSKELAALHKEKVERALQLVRAKEEQVEELELQLAEARGHAAMELNNRLDAEQRASLLQSVAAKLKVEVVKHGRSMRNIVFDEAERRTFMAL